MYCSELSIIHAILAKSGIPFLTTGADMPNFFTLLVAIRDLIIPLNISLLHVNGEWNEQWRLQ